MLAIWERWRRAGERPILAAPDASVVRALRSSVRHAGGEPGEVVGVRELAARLARVGSPEPVVVLGPLPDRHKSSRRTGCVQVAVVPPSVPEADRLGRAAEVARPSYLVAELGPVPTRPAERTAWRGAATAVESFRHRWSIDDAERALGARSVLGGGPTAARDLAETKLKVGRALRAIDRRLETEHAMPARQATRQGAGRSR